MSNQHPQSPLPPAPLSVNTRPSPLQLLFHLGKTVRLTGALLRDGRVTIFRKLLFVGSVLLLMLALLLPETVGELIVPFFSFVEIPADIALDWVAVAVASYNLLRVFPAEIVSEHYNRLFRPVRTINPS